jgi:hypothetical protein
VGYVPGYKVFLPSKMGISAHFTPQSMGIREGAIHESPFRDFINILPLLILGCLGVYCINHPSDIRLMQFS